MPVRRLLLALCITLGPIAPFSAALGQSVELPGGVRPLVSGEQAAIAGLILLVTGLGDEGLREEFQEHRGGTTNSVARVGNAIGDPVYVIPAIGVSYLAGQLTGNHNLTRLAWNAGRAALVASGVTTALKYTIGRTRPSRDGDSDHFQPFGGATSFPSGHTTLAFAMATVIADETHDSWSDPLVYAAATVTAYARVNDDRHWVSDVFAGALVGHLSARFLSRRQGSLLAGPQAVGLSLPF